MSELAESCNDVAQRPGPLRGSACLALHTHQAARLLHGRARQGGQAGIFGLFAFARALRTLEAGATEHDPYARWWQAKVRTALNLASEQLPTRLNTLAEKAVATEGLTVAEVQSVRPVVVELRFASPLAYRAAQLLGTYDRLVLGALSLRHVEQLAAEEADQLIRDGGRYVRRALLSPTGYHRTGVQFADLRAGNALAEKVEALMGPLPDDWGGGALSRPGRPAHAAAPAQHSTVLTAVQ